MISFTETIQLGRLPVVVPLLYDGKPRDPEKATAVQMQEAARDAGVLLYRIGVHNSKIMPQGYRDGNTDILKMYEMEIDARGASELARVFFQTGLMAGPTVFSMEQGMSPPNWLPHLLRGLTPVLVPHRVHMETVHDALCATNLPADLIHQAVAKVTDIRNHARAFAA